MPLLLSLLPRAALSFCVAGICLYLAFERLEGIGVSQSVAALSGTAPQIWIGAVVATWISFAALGRYDGVAHRHFATGQPTGAARRAGQASIALSQTIGFGLLTGAFVRWRLLPGLGPVRAARLTGFVALSFILALAGIAALVLLVHPLHPAMQLYSAVGLLAAFSILALSFWMPTLSLGRVCVTLPSLTAIAAILFWTALDTIAACTALWFLLSQATDLSWFTLYPAFLLALGAATLSGAPGGVGPFELTLIALLPTETTLVLLPALLGYRLVYFALPALLALPLLIGPGTRPARAHPRETNALPADLGRAETGLIKQNGGQIMSAGTARLAVLQTPQASVALFDPVQGRMSAPALRALAVKARLSNRRPCLYKCGAMTALQARRAGWRVVRIAKEAVLDPREFSTDGPERRQLRRKLRQAEKPA